MFGPLDRPHLQISMHDYKFSIHRAISLNEELLSLTFTLSRHRQVKQEEVPSRVSGLQAELKSASKEIADLRSQLAVAKSQVCVRR